MSDPVTMNELGDETPEVLRYRRVSLAGEYRSDQQFLAEGLSHAGRPGLHVLTPFRLGNEGIIMVNRGWIPETRTRTDYPDLSVDQSLRTIAGRIVPFPQPGLRLDSEPGISWPRRIVYPTSQDIAAALGAGVYPHMIWLDADADDGFVRAWTPSEFGPARHIGYAVQWFGMATALVLIYIVLRFRRSR
jgi:surfeit locus 1 family protein